jgi:hypothetical protein
VLAPVVLIMNSRALAVGLTVRQRRAERGTRDRLASGRGTR